MHVYLQIDLLCTSSSENPSNPGPGSKGSSSAGSLASLWSEFGVCGRAQRRI